LTIKFDDKKDNTALEDIITKKKNGIIGFPISFGYFK
jgi:hypothetical protein